MNVSIKDMLNRADSGWLSSSGPDSEYVLSTRVRLARNVDGISFPGRSDNKDCAKVLRLANEACKELNRYGHFDALALLKLSEFSELEKRIFVEKHLMSINHLHSGLGGLIVNGTESVSVMVNEEDHFRIQALGSGLDLDQMLDVASRVDDVIGETVEYAFDDDLGYLTSCPTNLGTGLRASVMMHLPALVLTGQIGRVVGAMNKLGAVIRGFYGEGTEATGNVFQVSNQVTLGQTEQDIVKNLEGMVRQIIKQEASARASLMESSRSTMEDRVWRAYGTLVYARMLPWEEATQLLSDVRLGVDLGLIDAVSIQTLNRLMITIRPAFMQHQAGRDLSTGNRRIYRAETVRKMLATGRQEG